MHANIFSELGEQTVSLKRGRKKKDYLSSNEEIFKKCSGVSGEAKTLEQSSS